VSVAVLWVMGCVESGLHLMESCREIRLLLGDQGILDGESSRAAGCQGLSLPLLVESTFTERLCICLLVNSIVKPLLSNLLVFSQVSATSCFCLLNKLTRHKVPAGLLTLMITYH
jgi:hypothetical protein